MGDRKKEELGLVVQLLAENAVTEQGSQDGRARSTVGQQEWLVAGVQRLPMAGVFFRGK